MRIWLVIAVVLYLLWRFLVRSGTSQPRAAEGEMVRDPACGVYLPRHEAVRARHKGETYYFCSRTCRDQFKQRKPETGSGDH